MPALVDDRPLTQFRALASAGKVDATAGVIYGVSVITQGPALGHNVTVDEKGIKQCLEACQEFGEEGVKLVINHDSGFQEIVGSVKNFRIAGLQLLGDAYLLDTPADRAHILELAQKLPKNIGLSVETYGEPEELEKKKYWRVTAIDAIALVPNPAANKSGLFSKKSKTALEKISVEELREQIRKAAQADPRFAQTDDNSCLSAWPVDLIADGEDWTVIIDNGTKCFRVGVLITDGQVSLDADEEEVIRTVDYRPVDNSQDSNLNAMTKEELQSAIDAALKPVTDKLTALEAKFSALGDTKTALEAATKDKPDVAKLVANAMKTEGEKIAADAVTKFAASCGLKPAPDGKTEDGTGGDQDFEAKIKTQLAAGAKNRAIAILRASNDDPEGYNEWRKKQGN